MELSKDQIKEIAEELDCGMKVYVNTETKEIKTIIDFESHYMAEEELWEDTIKEIEENIEKYIEFEKMSSRESFEVMEEFSNSVDDVELAKKLELGLSLSKPFRNFKDIIDDSGEYREKWFAFKNDKYIEWVKEQLAAYNSSRRD